MVIVMCLVFWVFLSWGDMWNVGDIVFYFGLIIKIRIFLIFWWWFGKIVFDLLIVG